MKRLNRVEQTLFSIPILAVSLFASLGPYSFFLTNDTALVKAMVSGEFTGRPVPSVPFVSPVLGQLLAFAYNTNDQVPWFQLILVLPPVLGLFLWVQLAESRTELIAKSVALIPAVFLLGFRPDFTVSAIVSTGLGAMVAVSAVKRCRGLGTILGGIALVIVGFLLRDKAAALSLVLVVPSLVAEIIVWPSRERFESRRTLGTLFLIALAVLFAGATSAAMAHLNKDDSFAAYNDVRGALHGTAALSVALDSADTLSAIQWTPEMAELFEGFVYLDHERFGLESITLLTSLTPSVIRDPLAPWIASVQRSLESRNFLTPWPSSAVLTLLAGLVGSVAPGILSAPKRRLLITLVGLVIGWFIGLMLAVSTVRLPVHVLLPCSSICVLAMTGLSWSSPRVWSVEQQGSEGRRLAVWSYSLSGLGVLPVAALLGLSSHSIPKTIAERNQIHADRDATVDALIQSSECEAFVYVPRLSNVSLLDTHTRNGWWSEPVIPLGWSTFMSAKTTRIQTLSGEDTIVDALITKPSYQHTSLCLISPRRVADLYSTVLFQLNVGAMRAVNVHGLDSVRAGSGSFDFGIRRFVPFSTW